MIETRGCELERNKIQYSRLSTATSLRLLGVQISSDLTWNEQVSSVTNKCNKLLGYLRTIVGNQNQNILLTLYRSLVLPIIDFRSPVWLVYRKNHINDLETIQRRATRCATVFGGVVSRDGLGLGRIGAPGYRAHRSVAMAPMFKGIRFGRHHFCSKV